MLNYNIATAAKESLDSADLFIAELAYLWIIGTPERMKTSVTFRIREFNGEVAYGFSLEDRKGRYSVSGEGRSFSEAVHNALPELRIVRAQYDNAGHCF